jgi:hypothetical protein
MNALAIALTDLRRVLRDRAAVFWIFVGPVIFVVFFGILFPVETPRPTAVVIVNRDQDDFVARAVTVLTVFAFASASLGLVFGTLFKDADTCVTTALWTSILLAPLGGLWWPLEIVGPTMRLVGHLVPTGWGMEGVDRLLAFGVGAREVAPFAAALVGLTVVSLAVAARRLRPSA